MYEAMTSVKTMDALSATGHK